MMSLTPVAMIALYSVDSELVLWTTSTTLSFRGSGYITLDMTWTTPLVATWSAMLTLQPLAVTVGGGIGYERIDFKNGYEVYVQYPTSFDTSKFSCSFSLFFFLNVFEIIKVKSYFSLLS